MVTEISSGVRNYAVVIGLEGINGLQTARVLARRGIPVVGIANTPDSYCCRTNVCDRIIFADSEGEALIDTLEELSSQLDAKAVIYPCYDLNVLAISRYRERLEPSYHVALPERKIVELLLHKTSFYAYAQQEGFPIPRTMLLRNADDARFAMQLLEFPCVLKPAIRSKEWEENSKFKVYKTESPNQFYKLYETCSAWGETLVVQEWIQGSEENNFTFNGYFNSAGVPLATFVSRKIRQWPPQTGEGCLGEACKNDVVVSEAVHLFQHVRLSGLSYLEMKFDVRRQKYFIVEPNIGRPTGRSALSEAVGVELLYTMYCDLLGLDLPTFRQQNDESVKWIFIRRDIQSSYYYWRRGDLTLRKWLQSLRGRKVFALFSWTDPGPFLSDLLRSVNLFLKKVLGG